MAALSTRLQLHCNVFRLNDFQLRCVGANLRVVQKTPAEHDRPPVGIREIGMPNVEDEYQPRSGTFVPNFMFKRIIEDDHFVFKPSSGLSPHSNGAAWRNLQSEVATQTSVVWTTMRRDMCPPSNGGTRNQPCAVNARYPGYGSRGDRR